MMKWDDTTIPELKRLRLQEGLSFRQIAKRLRITRNAACGAVQRHVLGKHVEGGKGYRRKNWRMIQPRLWTEESLTEPYAAYKIRKRMEREAAR